MHDGLTGPCPHERVYRQPDHRQHRNDRQQTEQDARGHLRSLPGGDELDYSNGLALPGRSNRGGPTHGEPVRSGRANARLRAARRAARRKDPPVIDLSKYRIIDFSPELAPGETRTNGHHENGEPFRGRWIEVQEVEALGARMHKIQTQTHLGVHAEAAYKYDAEGADLARMPLSAYLGEAVACDFSAKESGAAVDAEDFEALGVHDRRYRPHLG